MTENRTSSPLTLETLNVLRTVLDSLVERPEELSIHPVEGAQSVVFEVSAGEGDLKKVIGREGRTANALRTLLWNLTRKHGRTYLLLILDPIPGVAAPA